MFTTHFQHNNSQFAQIECSTKIHKAKVFVSGFKPFDCEVMKGESVWIRKTPPAGVKSKPQVWVKLFDFSKTGNKIEKIEFYEIK